jgi:hypothetical protein
LCGGTKVEKKSQKCPLFAFLIDKMTNFRSERINFFAFLCESSLFLLPLYSVVIEITERALRRRKRAPEAGEKEKSNKQINKNLKPTKKLWQRI